MRDIALGERDDVDASKREALEEAGGVFLIAAEAIERFRHPPSSYAEIAESPEYNWPLSALPPGVLAVFDLPDCYRELKAKDLRLLEPLGARGRT